MENAGMSTCDLHSDDLEEINVTEVGSFKTKPFKNGITAYAYVNSDRHCDQLGLGDVIEKDESVARKRYTAFLEELGVNRDSDYKGNQSLPNADMPDSQDDLNVNDVIFETNSAEVIKIKSCSENCDIQTGKSAEINPVTNCSPVLVPLSTADNCLSVPLPVVNDNLLSLPAVNDSLVALPTANDNLSAPISSGNDSLLPVSLFRDKETCSVITVQETLATDDLHLVEKRQPKLTHNQNGDTEDARICKSHTPISFSGSEDTMNTSGSERNIPKSADSNNANPASKDFVKNETGNTNDSNCIHEKIPLVSFTANNHTQNSSCSEILSDAEVGGHISNIVKETSEQERVKKDIHTFVIISSSFVPSSVDENPKIVTCCESNVAEATFDRNICNASTNNFKQENVEESIECSKTASYQENSGSSKQESEDNEVFEDKNVQENTETSEQEKFREFNEISEQESDQENTEFSKGENYQKDNETFEQESDYENTVSSKQEFEEINKTSKQESGQENSEPPEKESFHKNTDSTSKQKMFQESKEILKQESVEETCIEAKACTDMNSPLHDLDTCKNRNHVTCDEINPPKTADDIGACSEQERVSSDHCLGSPEICMTVKETVYSEHIEMNKPVSETTINNTVYSDSELVNKPESPITVHNTRHCDKETMNERESPITVHNTVYSDQETMNERESPITVHNTNHCDKEIMNERESPITVHNTVYSDQETMNERESPITVHNTVYSDQETMNERESPITVHNTRHCDRETMNERESPITTKADAVEKDMIAHEMLHSESKDADRLKTVHKMHRSESIEESISESYTMIIKTERSLSEEENIPDPHRSDGEIADHEDREEDVDVSQKLVSEMPRHGHTEEGEHDSVSGSKKRKRKKVKKGHKKKSKRHEKDKEVAENSRFIEVVRDKQSVESLRMEERGEEKSLIDGRLSDEMMFLGTHEDISDPEVGNQRWNMSWEPGELEMSKRKKGKKKKKKRRRRVATVEEGEGGENDSHRFPTHLDGFFLRYEDGVDEVLEENTSVSFEHNRRMLEHGGSFYRRHHRSESDGSVRSVPHADIVTNRYEELDHRRHERSGERRHPERKKKRERSSSSWEAQCDRGKVYGRGYSSREDTFERERDERESDERLGGSNRKMRRADRQRERDKEVVPRENRRQVQEEEERRHATRSSSRDHRLVIVERSLDRSAHSESRREHANDKNKIKSPGKANHAHQNKQMQKSYRTDKHLSSPASQLRYERGSDKENRRGHKRRHERTSQGDQVSNHRGRVRSERRVQERGTSTASSNSTSSIRHRGDCIVISLGNSSDDDGASSDVILVESERIVINLDDDDDVEQPPKRNISRGDRNEVITMVTKNKSVQPPAEHSASHHVQTEQSASHRVQTEQSASNSAQTQRSASHHVERERSAGHHVQTGQSASLQTKWSASHNVETERSASHSVQTERSTNHSVQTERSTNHSVQTKRSANHNVQSSISPGKHKGLRDSAEREGRPSTPPSPRLRRTVASPLLYPPEPAIRNGSSIMAPGPECLLETSVQSQQRLSEPLPGHLPADLGGVTDPPYGSARTTRSPGNLPAAENPIPGLSQTQSGLLPLLGGVPHIPVQNSKLPVLPCDTMQTQVMQPPPPPPFGVCLPHHVPIPTESPVFQGTGAQQHIERSHRNDQDFHHGTDHFNSQHTERSHRNDQDIHQRTDQLNSFHAERSPENDQEVFQGRDVFNSFHTSTPLQASLPGTSPLCMGLSMGVSSGDSQSFHRHDGRNTHSETLQGVDMDISSDEDDYHLELLSPKANSHKDHRRRNQPKLHSSGNQGTSAVSAGAGSAGAVTHVKTLSRGHDKVVSQEHASHDKYPVYHGKRKRQEDSDENDNVDDDDDDVPASAADLTCKEKFLQKLYFQERVIEEVKMAIKPFYSSKKINKEQYKVILRKAVPKVCHNKKGNINPQKIQHLVEAYVRKMSTVHQVGGGGGEGRRRPSKR